MSAAPAPVRMSFRRRPLVFAASVLAVLGAPSPATAAVVERVTIGRSVQGRDLKAVNIGAASHQTRVLIIGCIHGNECAGKAIVRELKEMDSPKGYELWIVRDLNPDGSRIGTRQNARGVDLNRNFRAGWRSIGAPGDTYHSGSRPFSEPESRAARDLIKELKPDVTIWYHQAMSLVTKHKRHRRVQRHYAEAVGLPWVRLDPLPGTATRWQNKRFPGQISFVVELPSGSLTTASARRHARAVRSTGRLWNRHRSP